MTLLPEFDSIGDERFASLTTFRKSGEPVSVPVWIAKDDDALIVTTPDGTGKVKRLRNDARVELRPCSRTGKVADDAVAVHGVGEVRSGPEVEKRLTDVFLTKYRLEYRIFMMVERLSKAGRKPRVLIRITPAT